MKKILSLIGVISLMFIASTNLVACNSHAKNDLKMQITSLTSLNNAILIDFNKKNSDLDKKILQAQEILQLKPVVTGIVKIQYFNTEKNEITNNLQNLSFIFIKLSIINDFYWQGSTDFLPLKLIRTKLDIGNMNIDFHNFDNKVTVIENVPFCYLNPLIRSSEAIQNLTPKLFNYEIKYYDNKNKEVTNQRVRFGKIYIIILVTDEKEPFYTGSTNPIWITIYQEKEKL